MLLVDDDEAEFAEGDRLLYERVSAGHRREPTQRRCRSAILLTAARSEPTSISTRTRASLAVVDVARVLLGEDFGRHHQRRLVAVLHNGEHRQQRDRRLAAPTSPASRRFIGTFRLHVGEDAFDERSCACVSVNGRTEKMSSRMRGVISTTAPFCSFTLSPAVRPMAERDPEEFSKMRRRCAGLRALSSR